MAEGGAGLKRVLVTGATGFIASHIVRVLLARGYEVVGTTRDASNDTKCGFLRSLPNAEKLSLVSADLLTPGAFDEAVKGCEGVFHTASPFFYAETEAELVEPAVKGTANVMGAALSAGVRRVVLTSSTAAVVAGSSPKDAEKGWDASVDWSDEAKLREWKSWYPLSKTLAERSAWEFMEESKPPYDLVVLNPTLVTGPMLQPTLNTSSKTVRNIMCGRRAALSRDYMSFVDVRDVADAHVNAMETPEASGKRFLLVASSIPWTKVGDTIREALPEDLRADVTSAIDDKEGSETKYDTSPAQTLLNIKFISSEESIKASVESILNSPHWPLEK